MNDVYLTPVRPSPAWILGFHDRKRIRNELRAGVNLLGLVTAPVELLLEVGVKRSLLVSLACRVALVLEIALDLLVVRSLLTGLLESDILQKQRGDSRIRRVSTVQMGRKHTAGIVRGRERTARRRELRERTPS